MSILAQKKEIIYWSGLLNQKGFVTARSGNISYKVDSNKILITSHDCYLGHLESSDILLVDLEGNILKGDREITSEKELHLKIHKKFDEVKVVMHTHPAFTTAFFHYFDRLDIFSFEAKFYLGNIQTIPQETPVVTDIKPVLGALENSNVIVLKGHGAVSLGKDFKEAFSLVELLEEQSKVNLFIKNSKSVNIAHPSGSDDVNTKHLKAKKTYKLMSKDHITRLTSVINNDVQVQDLGRRYGLSCTLAIKNQDSGQCICFHYQKGKIIKVDDNDDAEFLITGRAEVLKKVFNRQIEPFVAATQGKVKTKGDFSKMSQWYPVLVRTFKLWEEAPVE